MTTTTSGVGLSKHRKGGSCNINFTGPKGSNTKRKRKSSRKQRRLKRGTDTNKYAYLLQ